jgi:hypothetical protein
MCLCWSLGKRGAEGERSYEDEREMAVEKCTIFLTSNDHDEMSMYIGTRHIRLKSSIPSETVQGISL